MAKGEVTFRWKDYAHGNKQRKMTVSGEEFLRRFLLHVLRKGFIRIRFFGFLAPRRRAQLLPLCQQLLALQPPSSSPTPAMSQPPVSWHCPRCGGAMKRIEKLTAQQIPSRVLPVGFGDPPNHIPERQSAAPSRVPDAAVITAVSPAIPHP